jgi:hypothetical protein
MERLKLAHYPWTMFFGAFALNLAVWCNFGPINVQYVIKPEIVIVTLLSMKFFNDLELSKRRMYSIAFVICVLALIAEHLTVQVSRYAFMDNVFYGIWVVMAVASLCKPRLAILLTPIAVSIVGGYFAFRLTCGMGAE